MRDQATAGTGAAEAYAGSLDHLRDELEWLGLRLDAAFGRAGATADGRSGADARREAIDARVAASLTAGIELRLPRLARLFGLTPFERDVVLACLAPEVSLEYRARHGQPGDMKVGQLLRLFCETPREEAWARSALSGPGRLLRYGLLRHRGPAGADEPLIGRSLRLDEGISVYLLESDALDPGLSHCAALLRPAAGTDPASSLAEAFRAHLAEEPRATQWVAFLHGPERDRRAQAVEDLCGAANLAVLRIDLPALLADASGPRPALRRALRAAVLAGAAAWFEDADALAREGESGVAMGDLEAALRELGWITFIGSREPLPAGDWTKRQRCFSVDFPLPGYAERRRLWQQALDAERRAGSDADPDALAAQYRFGRNQVANAVALARNLVRLRDPAAAPGRRDLEAACRIESSARSIGFAQRVESAYEWEDLVLPAAQKAQLLEVVEFVRRREAVFGEWGFGRKHPWGAGTSAIFSGPSGTGKTMAAGVVAAELGLDLFRIDLSLVVSKYIGETEKNLARVFDDARDSSAILFFDEADALFGRRSEVRDAHDRYANIEVNYLLQRLEQHDGVVILATNLASNMDDAFLRRIRFSVSFPVPERSERLEMWRRVFPREAPLAPDIDLDFLARQFKITGAHIRNIAVAAAFLAQREESAIAMRHVILATQREFGKMGRIVGKSDFGDYHELVA